MFKKLSLLITAFLFLFFTGSVQAFKPETFVTFSNPVRGPEGWQGGTQGILDLPRYQYQESTHSGLPITWLLRYDAIKDSTTSAFFKDLIEVDKNQTLGAFLEITPNLTSASHVAYPSGNLFFNANRIFLSGYTLDDRIRLIDTFMEAFFSRFGFYPKSVSAWHLDSYSLQYLQSKYSVLIAMNCDDQYTTDHYRIWGGYLGSPYFPDKNNSLVPADSFNNRVNLAMVRWAQRDLFNFYGERSESSYSVQVNDYLSMGQNTKYFEKLLAQYGQKNLNEFTYINIGLENDYSLSSFKSEIRDVYSLLKKDQGLYNLHFMALSEFGDWFKARYPESTPAYYYESTDPKGVSPDKIFWYQSPYYRLGLKSVNGKTHIIDFRVYNRNIYEDFISTPNESLDLFHEIPAVIDSIKSPGTELLLSMDLEKSVLVRSKQWDGWQIGFQSGEKTLTLYPDKIGFVGFSSPGLLSKDLKVVSNKAGTTWYPNPYTPFKDTTHFTLLFWIVVIISSILFIKKIKKNHSSSLRDNTQKWQSHAIFVVGITIALLAGLTVFRNGLLYPFGMGFWGPNGHDAIFHLSFIEKFATNPFSFSHPQIAGEKISNYHFLFDFISGIVVKLFGVSSLDLYFRLFPVIAGIAIVFLLDKMLQSWKYTRQERLLAIFLAFLAGSFGFIPKLLAGQSFLVGESSFWANQSVSIFLNPPYALSLIVLLIFLIVIVTPDLIGNLYKSNSLFLLSLLGGLLAQTKVYAFILLLGALLFSRKYKLFIGVLIVGFLISLPFTTFGGPSPFIFSPLWFPKSLFASFDRLYWPRLVSAWQAYEATGSFLKLGLVNLFALVIFLLGNLGMRLFGLFHLFNTKLKSDSETIVSWIIIFGLLLPLFFVQNVNPWNTIQFMYYALFFLAIFTAKYMTKLKIYFLIPFLFLAIITSFGTLKDYIGFYSASRISYTELLALDKLRDQPKGIVLAPIFNQFISSKVATPKPLYSYISTAYISGLSGQPELLSDTINLDITGFKYKEKVRDILRFCNTLDKKWAVDFLIKNKISYVYVTPLQKLKLAPFDLNLTKIFDSGEINIYKFN